MSWRTCVVIKQIQSNPILSSRSMRCLSRRSPNVQLGCPSKASNAHWFRQWRSSAVALASLVCILVSWVEMARTSLDVASSFLRSSPAFLLSIMFFSTVTSWLLWRWTSPWVQERAFATLTSWVSWASTFAVSSATLLRRDFCSSTKVDSRAVCPCCCQCSVRTSVHGAIGSLGAGLLSALIGVSGMLCRWPGGDPLLGHGPTTLDCPRSWCFTSVALQKEGQWWWHQVFSSRVPEQWLTAAPPHRSLDAHTFPEDVVLHWQGHCHRPWCQDDSSARGSRLFPSRRTAHHTSDTQTGPCHCGASTKRGLQPSWPRRWRCSACSSTPASASSTESGSRVLMPSFWKKKSEMHENLLRPRLSDYPSYTSGVQF